MSLGDEVNALSSHNHKPFNFRYNNLIVPCFIEKPAGGQYLSMIGSAVGGAFYGFNYLPDEEWRSILDNFVATFGIIRHFLLEYFCFYLLDDHSDRALQIRALMRRSIFMNAHYIMSSTIPPQVSEFFLLCITYSAIVI